MKTKEDDKKSLGRSVSGKRRPSRAAGLNPPDQFVPNRVDLFPDFFADAPLSLSPWPTTSPAGLTQFPASDSAVHVNTKLTPRHVNTLLRLYNCSGPVVHLE